ncbi:MAG: MFS transporter [Bacteroidaceae bacterium]|nr:MFS transporter [Bacteroidaceae bacterium]
MKPYSWVPSLYIAESLPYVAVMVIATTMYKRLGLSNTELAFYTSWLYLPWVIKPLWSPFIAAHKSERWWILIMELLVGAGFAGIALTLNLSFWLQGTLAFFWLLAFASATHDIAADGIYIVGLSTHDQSLYVGIRSTFYRIGTILGQGGLVMLAGLLERHLSISAAWSVTFLVLAGVIILLALWHTFSLPRIENSSLSAPDGCGDTGGRPLPAAEAATFRSLFADFGETIRIFFTKPHILPALLFMLFFRFPEGQLVKIANPFMLDDVSNGGLGLATETVGFIYGTIGIIGLTLGGLLGGWCVSRHGLKKWFWPMVLSISLPDLVYVWFSSGDVPSFLSINIGVFIEQFGYGFGFTAYMLFLVAFSQGARSTAVFAICTAFQALGMMLPGMIAGQLSDTLGYYNFFWWVVACCCVTVAVSALIHIDPEYGKKE